MRITTNQEVAELLSSVAAAYKIKKANRFRIIAYERAAAEIEQGTREVKELWQEGRLAAIPGVGVNIAKHLDELFRTGKVKHFQKVMKTLPPAMFVFLKIPGVGPKTAYKLCRKLGIKKAANALERLRQAAKDGKARVQLLDGINQLGRRQDKMLLPFAGELAGKIISYLKEQPAVKEVCALGSLRRGCTTIGDIDLAVKTNQPKEIINHFVKYPGVRKIQNQGSSKASALLQNNRQVDLRVQNRSFGAMLQYFTGSKAHNIRLRELALKKGFSLSEYGIKKLKAQSSRLKVFEDEKSFYNYLDLEFIPPELRENQGEIEAARQNKLPDLMKLSDIKGDLHTHSNFQHQESSYDEGVSSFEEIIFQAIKLGYQYIGLGDHSPSVSQHTKSEIISLLAKRKQKIEQLKGSKKFVQFSQRENNREIKILNIMEVNILADGSLSVPEKGLELLDFACVSVHSAMRQDQKTMTKRVFRALAHPKVKFLAHPTGRLLLKREGYELDWEKIFEFCRKNNKWLEINAMPRRLDLPDFLVRQAIKAGVKLVIGTDSHHFEAMRLMKYGVIVARRGWAEKKDIINTLPWQEFQDKISV